MRGHRFWHHGIGCAAGETLYSADGNWKQFGFSVDSDGNPVTDCAANTVLGYSREEVELDLSETWVCYAGDATSAHLEDKADFEKWSGDKISDAEWREFCGEQEEK